MADREMPDPKPERETGAPGEQRQPNERAPRRDLGEREAARRQAWQDPLQHRERQVPRSRQHGPGVRSGTVSEGVG